MKPKSKPTDVSQDAPLLSPVELAALQEAIAYLYKQVDGVQTSVQQESHKTHDKLDQWIATNHQLLGVFQDLLESIAQHSEVSERVLNSSALQQRSLSELTNQVSRLQQALNLMQVNQQALQAVAMQSEAIQNGFEQHNGQLLELNGQLRELMPALRSSGESVIGPGLIVPTNDQLLQLKSDLQGVLSEVISQARLALPSGEETSPGKPLASQPRSPSRGEHRQRQRIRENLFMLLLLLLIVVVMVGGLGFGSGMLTAHALTPKTDARGLTQAESELLAWAKTDEGRMARDIMRWNPDVPQLCTESIDRLGGKCVLWVVSPRQRPGSS